MRGILSIDGGGIRTRPRSVRISTYGAGGGGRAPGAGLPADRRRAAESNSPSDAIIRKGVVFAKFMCATLSTLRTGCMAQSGRAAGGIAAAKLALSGANPT